MLSLLCNVTPPPMVVSEGSKGVHTNEVDKGANYISGSTVSFQRYWTASNYLISLPEAPPPDHR